VPALTDGRTPARLAARPPDPLLAAQVHFLDLLVRAFQPLWPWPAAEAALRAELLGRRLDDQRVLQRSLAFGAVVPIIIGRSSPAQLERAHRQLDAAEALARAHDLPLGRELAQLNRSLVWLATNVERARRTCEAALAGFARRGMLHSFDGDIARTFYQIILYIKGDEDDALVETARELDLGHPNSINVAITLTMRIALLCHRGDLDAGRAAAARLAAHLAGAPTSRLDFLCETARRYVLICEGRFADALVGTEDVERAARASGGWVGGIDRAFWLLARSEATIGLVRRGERPARRLAEARDAARWLVREAPLNFSFLGHRVLAQLEHAAGRRDRAARAITRALALSSANATPYYRWLCLETARDLGALTLDQESEAEELAAKGRFVVPVGWRD
jgi:hypothetical protein